MTPDYSTYTITELHEALERIDRDAFPERVTEIQQRLEQHTQAASTKPEHRAKEEPKKDLGPIGQIVAAVVGILFLWLGLDSLITGEAHGKRGGVYHIDTEPFMFYMVVSTKFFIVFAAAYSIVKARMKTRKTKQPE